MDHKFSDLSELLKYSIPAEALWAQLPEWVQRQAVAHGGEIHSEQELRRFAESASR